MSIYKINFQPNEINYDTGKAKLVKIPHSKSKVWLPTSIIHNRGWGYVAYLPRKFTFKVNNQNITAASLANFFDGIPPTDYVEPEDQIFYHEPKAKKPKKMSADDSLKR